MRSLLNKFYIIVIALIFVAAFFLMFFSAGKDSQTTDEAIHLFAGYTYLTRGDFRLDPEHPPFLKELAATPLLFYKNLKISSDGLWEQAGSFYYDSWREARTLGEGFFYLWGNDSVKLLLLGRLPFIGLTLLLGFTVFYWTKKLYGKNSAVLALFLTLFCPTVLAHGRLINTDVGITLFIFLTVYFWGNFLKKEKKISYFDLVFAGVNLGLVAASKYTGLLVIPAILILALVKFVLDGFDWKNLKKYFLGFLGITIIGFIVLWATYGFRIETAPQTLGNLSQNISLFLEPFRPYLFPADFFKGIVLVFRHAISGHGAYLLGQSSNMGWWYYFPVAIFFKTPIPIFILFVISAIFWRRLKSKNAFDEFLILLPPIVFLFLSMFSKADLGVRHVLPIFPFLFIYSARAINLIDFKKFSWQSVGFSILILWYLLGTILSFPNYLAYFNEFAGGSKNGYKYLNDSNLDWGQDLYRIKNYLEENKIGQVYIVYPWDGDAALNYYGINYLPLGSDQTNISGNVVISATYLEFGYKWLWQYPFREITPGVFIFNVR